MEVELKKREKKEKERGLFLSSLPPTDTNSVTMETFSSLNLISLTTLSIFFSFNHLQVYPFQTVGYNCHSSRMEEREKKKGCGGEHKKKVELKTFSTMSSVCVSFLLVTPSSFIHLLSAVIIMDCSGKG